METKRSIDSNGYLTVRDNPITKVGVFPYKGSEIGAPEPDRIYWVYRPEEELNNPETIESLKLVPFIDEHEVLGVHGMPVERKGMHGVTGENPYFKYPHLIDDIKIHSSAAQTLIENKKIDLSPGYRCWYEFKTGEYKGQKFDAVQRGIRFNHLALVWEGRTGPDVAVQDHCIFTIDSAELINMDKEKDVKDEGVFTPEQTAELQQMIAAAVAEALKAKAGTADQDPDKETTDEDPPADTGAGEAEVVAGAAVAAATEAEAVIEEALAAVEEVKAAAVEVEAAVNTADRAAAVKKVQMAQDKLDKALKRQLKNTGDSALKKEVADLRKQIAAQDSAAVIGIIAERDAMAKDVSHYVGTFDHSRMKDASEVARYACDCLSIKDVPKGGEVIAIKTYMQAVRPDHETIVTQDSASDSSAKELWEGK